MKRQAELESGGACVLLWAMPRHYMCTCQGCCSSADIYMGPRGRTSADPKKLCSSALSYLQLPLLAPLTRTRSLAPTWWMMR